MLNRYITENDFIIGLKCQRYQVSDYSTHVDFFGDDPIKVKEARDHYHLSRNEDWYDYELTARDVERLKLWNGDWRNSPGLPLEWFRVPIN